MTRLTTNVARAISIAVACFALTALAVIVHSRRPVVRCLVDDNVYEHSYISRLAVQFLRFPEL